MTGRDKVLFSMTDLETSQDLFVGGEFYTDNLFTLETPSISTEGMHFLNGGKACLTVIGDYLRDHGIENVLLPSYLCPTIWDTLENRGLQVSFYNIHDDLSIDLEDLVRKLDGSQAVYFINYFGFFHTLETQHYFDDLRRSSVIVIEDNAQVGFTNHPSGDFTFNSLRKLAPFDGGYLTTRFEMAPYIAKYHGLPNRRLPIIREYRAKLRDYLWEGVGEHEHLDALFDQAEAYYRDDLVVEGDSQERFQIEHLDWPKIKHIRRRNYQYLLDLIADIPEITPIFPALQEDNLPLGLPVYFSGVDRDVVNEELGKAGIGLTIHWEELRSDPRTCRNILAASMASRILTLAVDQCTSRKQLDYLVQHLLEGIQTAKVNN